MSFPPLLRYRNKAFKILGWLSITIFALLLLAWLQNNDPDCYLSTGVSLQLRMCNDEVVDFAPVVSSLLLLSLLALGVGILLLKLGRSTVNKAENGKSDQAGVKSLVASSVIELEDVIAFIREHQRLGERIPITSTTFFERDLGITGDDGVELLEDIQKRFGVSFIGPDGSLSGAFGLAADEYLFHSEGFNPFLFVANLFGYAIEKVRPLSVGQLHQVVAERQGIVRARQPDDQ